MFRFLYTRHQISWFFLHFASDLTFSFKNQANSNKACTRAYRAHVPAYQMALKDSHCERAAMTTASNHEALEHSRSRSLTPDHVNKRVSKGVTRKPMLNFYIHVGASSPLFNRMQHLSFLTWLCYEVFAAYPVHHLGLRPRYSRIGLALATRQDYNQA